MGTQTAVTRPTPQSIAAYVKKNAAQVKKARKHDHRAAVSVREADYHGHHILIRTRYEIEVDAIPLMGHMGVTVDGQVHYHPVPNLSFASAVDLVKRLIDIFPDDFDSKGHRMPGMTTSKPPAVKKGRR